MEGCSLILLASSPRLSILSPPGGRQGHDNDDHRDLVIYDLMIKEKKTWQRERKTASRELAEWRWRSPASWRIWCYSKGVDLRSLVKHLWCRFKTKRGVWWNISASGLQMKPSGESSASRRPSRMNPTLTARWSMNIGVTLRKMFKTILKALPWRLPLPPPHSGLWLSSLFLCLLTTEITR